MFTCDSVGAATAIELSQAHLAEIRLGGVPVPSYDRGRLAPRIVHVGVGGFHRAHLAVYVHELAAAGGDWGIVGLGLLARDAEMAAALKRQDHLYTLVEKGDVAPCAEVIGSIIGFVHGPPERAAEAVELIAAPATAILSLTVTEAGTPSRRKRVSARPSIASPRRWPSAATATPGRSRS